jgi:hypothetical protein
VRVRRDGEGEVATLLKQLGEGEKLLGEEPRGRVSSSKTWCLTGCRPVNNEATDVFVQEDWA